jgi:hypothetical protein
MAAMVIDMNDTQLCSLEQLKAFLDGTAGIQFRPFKGDDALLCAHQGGAEALGSSEATRAWVLRYLGRTTGYSRQQLTRLVQRCLATGGIAKRYRPQGQQERNDRTAREPRRHFGSLRNARIFCQTSFA